MIFKKMKCQYRNKPNLLRYFIVNYEFLLLLLLLLQILRFCFYQLPDFYISIFTIYRYIILYYVYENINNAHYFLGLPNIFGYFCINTLTT